MRKTMPNTYKLDTQDESGTIIRKMVSETQTKSQLFKRYFGENAE
jgi:cell division protein YceG involved in septum cleavage